MARKPANGDRKSPKPETKKTQSERFIETARELGVDETGEKFDRAFKKLVPVKPKPKVALVRPSGKLASK